MKDHAKVGNRKGKPAYRTQATFRYRKYLKGVKDKSARKNVATFNNSIK